MSGPSTLYYSAAVLSDIPLGYWRLNGNPNDSTIWNPHNGTTNDLITYGVAGPVIDFDGINTGATFALSLNGISLPSLAGFNLGALSFEAWIFNNDNTPSTYHTIMGLRTGSHIFIMSSSKKLQLSLQLSSGQKNVAGTTSIALNTWTHVVGTFDGSDVITLYINGVLEKQTAGLAGTLVAVTTSRIGQDNHSTAAEAWSGSLYGVALYPYCLSQQQALNHFNAATPTGITVTYTPVPNLPLVTNGGLSTLIDDDNYDFFDSDIPNQFNPFNNNIDINNQDDSDPDSDSEEDGDNE